MSSPLKKSPDDNPCEVDHRTDLDKIADLSIDEIRQKISVVQKSLRVLTGKWKWEILCLLIFRPVRFNELRRGIPGITQHMLAAQLKDMEADGLVLRRAYREMPPRVEYELTDAARALKPVAEALFEWGERHGEAVAAPQEDRRPAVRLAAAS